MPKNDYVICERSLTTERLQIDYLTIYHIYTMSHNYITPIILIKLLSKTA